MHALIAKEFQLVVHPSTYFLVALGVLVLIPNWPYAVVLLYGIMTAFFNALNARELRDLSYTFALPVSRRDMVRARVIVMMLIELAMIALMTICICLRPALGINEVAAQQPLVGMPANIALIGFALATFGLFNLVFFTRYFRDPMKIGIPFLLACIAMLIFSMLFEALPFILIEWCAAVSAPGFENLDAQLIVLVIGAVFFAGLNALAIRRAARVFESYDA